ncbi:hypothetical protein MPLDJ20_90122 [Mesorhizobium plurifarium]|uniref:Uncharacterized protein n=1 Tax=Mesorhizobium plurifarium TaxID=69974 RepID=A0A090FY15_MESPL|nr:hypothetical protein MPLDJ20_90122 [Mesorhizobium plurifarium]
MSHPPRSRSRTVVHRPVDRNPDLLRKSTARAGFPTRGMTIPLRHLVFRRDAPHHLSVFNELKGGDPMSSDFVFHNVSSADCTSGKQSSR